LHPVLVFVAGRSCSYLFLFWRCVVTFVFVVVRLLECSGRASFLKVF